MRSQKTRIPFRRAASTGKSRCAPPPTSRAILHGSELALNLPFTALVACRTSALARSASCRRVHEEGPRFQFGGGEGGVGMATNGCFDLCVCCVRTGCIPSRLLLITCMQVAQNLQTGEQVRAGAAITVGGADPWGGVRGWSRVTQAPGIISQPACGGVVGCRAVTHVLPAHTKRRHRCSVCGALSRSRPGD